MIRKFESRDLDAVMSLWLSANLQAHDFIAQSYWTSSYEMVKGLIPQAQTWVYEKNSTILGFLGLEKEYIAGIFVDDRFRSRGIGAALLSHAKSLRSRLTLTVYEKNSRAVSFYKREGFSVVKVQNDTDTGETELLMEWRLL